MDTKELEFFSRVYETGSMAKAAGDLFISSQGLSKAIGRLEAELGQTLFVRTHQGVVPTASAHALYPKVQGLVNTLESIRGLPEGGMPEETLRVFAASGVLAYTGVGFVRDFERLHPGWHLHVDECSDDYVIDVVGSGRAEIGFAAGPVDADTFDADLFSSHRHVIVVGEDHELALHDTVRLDDLNGRRIATLCGGYAPSKGILARLARSGVHPAETYWFAETYLGLMLAADDGVACVSTDYAAALQPWPHTVVVPFDEPDFTWDVYLVARRGTRLSPQARTFWDYALAWIDGHRGELCHWPLGASTPVGTCWRGR